MSSYDAADVIQTAESRPVRWLFASDNPKHAWDASSRCRGFGSVPWTWHPSLPKEDFSGLIFCAEEKIPHWLFHLVSFFFERDGGEANVFEYSSVWKNFRRISQEELQLRFML